MERFNKLWISFCGCLLALVFSTNLSATNEIQSDFNGNGNKEIFLQSRSSGGSSYIVTGLGVISQTLNNGYLGLDWSTNTNILLVDKNNDGRVDIQITEENGAEVVIFAGVDGTFNEIGIAEYIMSQLVPATTTQQTPITLSLSDFEISVPTYAGLTLFTLTGDDYGVVGNTIFPNANVNGDLSVRVKLFDGDNYSQVFTAVVNVTGESPCNNPDMQPCRPESIDVPSNVKEDFFFFGVTSAPGIVASSHNIEAYKVGTTDWLPANAQSLSQIPGSYKAQNYTPGIYQLRAKTCGLNRNNISLCSEKWRLSNYVKVLTDEPLPPPAELAAVIVAESTEESFHDLTIEFNEDFQSPFVELETYHSLTPTISETAAYYLITPQRLDEQSYQVTQVHPGYHRYRARTCNTESCSQWIYSQVLQANYQQLEFDIVRGNTGLFEKRASFGVSLDYEPLEEVIVNISSSDITEGIVKTRTSPFPNNNHAQLIFTPNNWNSSQAVTVIGQNSVAPNGVQDYQINFSIEGDMLNQQSVAMKGLAIGISIREEYLNSFLPGLVTELVPTVEYHGREEDLRYYLAQGPTGMSIDEISGSVSWKAPRVYRQAGGADNSTYSVRLRVTDGVRESFVDFNLTVPTLKKLATEMTHNSGHLATVTDNTTSLQHLSVEFDSSDSLSSGTVGVEQLESWPAYAGSVNRVSEVFMFDATVSGNVTLRIPLAEANVATGESLQLYYWNYQNPRFLPFWGSWLSGNVVTNEAGINFIEFNASALKGPYFIAYASEVILVDPLTESTSPNAVLGPVVCTPTISSGKNRRLSDRRLSDTLQSDTSF